MAPKLPKALGDSYLEAFVRLGYGDAFGLPVRSLHFRTERFSPDKAEKILSIVDSYNEFDGPEVGHVVKALGERGLIDSVSFGREYSPVLYLGLPREDRKRAAGEVMDVLQSFAADETDVVHGGMEVRAWWD